MLTFRNLRVSSKKYTMDLYETVGHIAKVVGINQTVGAEGDYARESGYTSEAYSRDEYWHSILQADIWTDIVETDGNVVIDACLPWGGEISVKWRNEDGQVDRLIIMHSSFPAHNTWGVMYRSETEQTPYSRILHWNTSFIVGNHDTIVRLVFSEVTDINGNVLLRRVSVYEGKKHLQTWYVKPYYCTASTNTTVSIKRRGAEVEEGVFMVKVNELSKPVEYSSIDAGEQVQAALSRVIPEPLIVFTDYETTLHIRRPGLHSEFAFPQSRYSNFCTVEERVDYRKMVSKVRLRSAYPEADYLDLKAADYVGYAFKMTNNPEIATVAEAQVEAERQQNILEGDVEGRIIRGPFCPLVCVEDGITFGGLNSAWLVNSMTLEIGGGKITGTLDLRRWIVPGLMFALGEEL